MSSTRQQPISQHATKKKTKKEENKKKIRTSELPTRIHSGTAASGTKRHRGPSSTTAGDVLSIDVQFHAAVDIGAQSSTICQHVTADRATLVSSQTVAFVRNMKRQENFDGPSPIFHEAKFPYIFI